MSKRQTSRSFGASVPQWMLVAAVVLTEIWIVFDARDSGVLKPFLLNGGAILLVSTLLFFSLGRTGVNAEWSLIHTLFVAWLAASALSLLTAMNARSFWNEYPRHLAWFVLFAGGFHFSRSVDGRKRSEAGLLIAAGVAIAVGLYQAMGMPGMETVTIQIDRTVVSTFGNATFFSGFLAMTIPFLLGLGLNESRPVARAIYGAALVAALYLIILTEGRSGWIGLAVGLALFAVLYRGNIRAKLLGVLALSALVAIALLAFPDIFHRKLGELASGHVPATVRTRIVFWEAAWKSFLHSPLIGNGVGNSIHFVPPFRSPEYWLTGAEDIVDHIHSEPLEILAESGIVGFIPWLSLISVLLFTLLRSARSEKRDAALIGMICGIAAFLVDNCSSMDIRMTGMAAVFWFLAGTALGGSSLKTRLLSFTLPSGWSMLRYAVVPVCAVALYFIAASANRTVESRKAYTLGEQQQETNPPLAARYFNLSVRLDPSFNDGRYSLAYNLSRVKMFNDAKRHLDTLLADDPTYPKAHLLLGIASSELGDSAVARKELERELSIATYSTSYHFAAIIARRAKDSTAEFRLLTAGLRYALTAGKDSYVASDLSRLPDLAAGEPSRIAEIRALTGQCGSLFRSDSAISESARYVTSRIPSR